MQAHKSGQKAGIYCGDGKQVKKYVDLGVDMVNVVTDVNTLT